MVVAGSRVNPRDSVATRLTGGPPSEVSALNGSGERSATGTQAGRGPGIETGTEAGAEIGKGRGMAIGTEVETEAGRGSGIRMATGTGQTGSILGTKAANGRGMPGSTTMRDCMAGERTTTEPPRKPSPCRQSRSALLQLECLGRQMIACKALPLCRQNLPPHTPACMCVTEEHHTPVLQARGPSRLQSETPEPRADHHRPRRPTPGAAEVSPWRISNKLGSMM